MTEKEEPQPTSAFSLDELSKESNQQRLQKISDLIQSQLVRILDIDQSLIKGNTSFFDIGMSSLNVEQLSQELNVLFGQKCEISPTTIFDYYTIDLLSTYIESNI